MAEIITVKSSGGKIELWLDGSQTYADLREKLVEKLERNKRFYMGTASPVTIFGKRFSDTQKRELRVLLESNYGFQTIEFADDEPAVEPERESQQEEKEPRPESFGEQSVFKVETIRSGQRIVSEGDIVIVGDVNAAQSCWAGGSIAVFGKLRGLAHAGLTVEKMRVLWPII